MAFVSFKAEGRISYGVAREDGVFDLGRRLGMVLPDLKSFLTAQGLGILGTVPQATATDYAAGEFTYLPVIPNPSKILCVGLNYVEHRRETGRASTEHPAIFTRFADTLTAHESAILLPPNSSALDYEGELAVVICKSAFRVSESEAMSVVGGYSVFNDGSVRDWQHHTHQFIPGKNFPRTGAFGPALVPPAEAGVLADKRIETRLAGVSMQLAQLGDMIFSIPKIISYISQFTRLSPGDVIATGTPGGVGVKREPPVFMKAGDRVEVSIEGIGRLTNTIEREADAPAE
ncbi:MAG: fumarylacetoacetate hydrolase family protein [Acidobacteriota bacterium]|nr:fumarylacetoacetate hydrolase family protein [Acidobacteriota bacterium]